MTTILLLLAGILLLILLITYIIYRMAFRSDRRHPVQDLDLATIQASPEKKEEMRDLIRAMLAIPGEDVSVTSFDGLRLVGRYYKRKEDAPLVICFHGYKGTACRDFSGGGQLVLRHGFNLLLVDERAQGRSEGRAMTFGILERRDALTWIDYAEKALGHDTILIAGISMGASTVLMTPELGLPASVKGIFADCPFNRPSDIIMAVGREMMHLPLPNAAVAFVALAARLFAGFDLFESTPAQAVKSAQIPIVIVHGLADSFVPARFSKEIADAAPDRVRRYTFEGAEHGLSYYADIDRYRQIFADFLELTGMTGARDD